MANPDPKPDRNSKPEQGLRWGAYLALGTQLTGIVCLGLLAGYGLDQKFSWTPWGMCAGGLLGSCAGLYHFVKATL